MRTRADISFILINRPNLTVESKSLTTRIIMEGKRAVGVEFEQNGTKRKVFANKEVCILFMYFVFFLHLSWSIGLTKRNMVSIVWAL